MPPAALTAPPPRVTEPVRYPASFEAFQALPEGTRAQYLDGHAHISPVPLRRH